MATSLSFTEPNLRSECGKLLHAARISIVSYRNACYTGTMNVWNVTQLESVSLGHFLFMSRLMQFSGLIRLQWLKQIVIYSSVISSTEWARSVARASPEKREVWDCRSCNLFVFDLSLRSWRYCVGARKIKFWQRRREENGEGTLKYHLQENHVFLKSRTPVCGKNGLAERSIDINQMSDDPLYISKGTVCFACDKLFLCSLH